MNRRKSLNGPCFNKKQQDLFVRVSKELSSPQDRRMSGPPPKERFTIYTDGGCWPNPGGPGAWAFIALKDRKKVHEDCGFEDSTTNNRMELTAVLQSLCFLPEFSGATIITDSQYAQMGASVWVHKWFRFNWKFSKNSLHCIKNLDLWKQIYELSSKRYVDFEWVRGHSGDFWNEACDALAAECAQKHKVNTNLYV